MWPFVFDCIVCVCMCARARARVCLTFVSIHFSPVVFVSLAFVSVFMLVFHNLCLRVWHIFLCVLCMCFAFNLCLCVCMCLAFMFVYVCMCL